MCVCPSVRALTGPSVDPSYQKDFWAKELHNTGRRRYINAHAFSYNTKPETDGINNGSCICAQFVPTGERLNVPMYTGTNRSGGTIKDKKFVKCDDAYFYNTAKKVH